MTDALIYLSFCFLGYIIAIPLRKYRDKITALGLLQTLAVCVLVLAMGFRIGTNREVIGNLGTYGVYALVITLMTFVCSVICVSFVRRFLSIDRHGLLASSAGNASGAGASAGVGTGTGDETDEASGPVVDKMTILIVVLVSLGLFLGYITNLRSGIEEETLNATAGKVIQIGLLTLLLFVGIDLGLEGQVFQNFKKVGARVLVIPIAIIVGSLAAGVVCALFLPISIKDGLAVTSGMAWYSLAPSIILDAGHVALGTISFMHNVMRELLAIIFIPIVAKKIGYVEAVALPGSPAMDVCLPIVERSTNTTTTIYSFISGLVLSFLVPVMVPFFV